MFINLAAIKQFVSPTVLLEFIYSAETQRVMEVRGSVRAVFNSNSMLYYVSVNCTFCFHMSIQVKSSGRNSVYGKLELWVWVFFNFSLTASKHLHIHGQLEFFKTALFSVRQ